MRDATLPQKIQSPNLGINPKRQLFPCVKSLIKDGNTPTEVTDLVGISKKPPAGPAPTPPPAPALASLDDTMAQLQSLGDDKDAKKALIQSLPETLKAQVMQELKARKDEEHKRASERDAELDNLL
jgi:hypothetical protein